MEQGASLVACSFSIVHPSIRNPYTYNSTLLYFFCFSDFHWNDGRIYQGEWKGSKHHGFGVLTDTNGTVIHEGMWLDHQPLRPQAAAAAARQQQQQRSSQQIVTVTSTDPLRGHNTTHKLRGSSYDHDDDRARTHSCSHERTVTFAQRSIVMHESLPRRERTIQRGATPEQYENSQHRRSYPVEELSQEQQRSIIPELHDHNSHHHHHHYLADNNDPHQVRSAAPTAARSSWGELPPNLPSTVAALIQSQQEALNQFNHHSTLSSSSKDAVGGGGGEHVHESKQEDYGDARYSSQRQQQYYVQQQQYLQQQQPYEEAQPLLDQYENAAQQQLQKTKERQTSQSERLAKSARRQQRALEKAQTEEQQRRMRQTYYGRMEARPAAPQEQRGRRTNMNSPSCQEQQRGRTVILRVCATEANPVVAVAAANTASPPAVLYDSTNTTTTTTIATMQEWEARFEQLRL
jgi:hypothetical protein